MASSEIELGRAAMVRRSWGEAYGLLSTAQEHGPLELGDIERLALAAYLTGHDGAATDAWTRAHYEAFRRSDPRRSAHNAFMIGADLMFRGEMAPAMGWFAMGGRVLEGDSDSAEKAWLVTWTSYARMWAGEPGVAEPLFAECLARGQAFEDFDLLTMARLGKGMCQLLQGRVTSGMSLLDEVMAAVTSGGVSPIYAGISYCTVVAACWDAFDVRRAKEWTAALTRWCEEQPDLVPFRGNCLVHRCELMQLQGDWEQAAAVAEQACDHLAGPVRWDTLGLALYQLGELQRLQGEFEAAEISYRRASAAGREPQPGLALLRLAQGRIDSAAEMIRRAVDEAHEPATRARLLPADVEIMIACGDLSSARSASQELQHLAASLDAPFLQAIAATATGAVLVAVDDPKSALSQLRFAATLWRDLDAPREVALVRVLVGLACRGLGDLETCAMEFDGARAIFERLGAGPDLQRLELIAVSAASGGSGGLTVREIEVLELVASGATNRAIASTLRLSEKTVARHVSNIFTKIGVPSRAAATAYAYEHGLVHPA